MVNFVLVKLTRFEIMESKVPVPSVEKQVLSLSTWSGSCLLLKATNVSSRNIVNQVEGTDIKFSEKKLVNVFFKTDICGHENARQSWYVK